MGRSKIEWCDDTWNPITGCRHGCEYCYAARMTRRFSGEIRINKMAKADYRIENGMYVLDKPMFGSNGTQIIYPFGFEPTYHRYKLDSMDKWKGHRKGNQNVFVGAMADIWGEWVPDEWILEILLECKKRPHNNYIFLTKNPQKMCDMANKGMLPEEDNFWYGTTLTRKTDRRFQGRFRHHTFVSIEPLLENMELGLGSLGSCEWVIIGAETGHRRNKVVPEKAWIDNILEAAAITQIPVFMKDSLVAIVGEENMRREFPEELKKFSAGKLYSQCCKCGKAERTTALIDLMAHKQRGQAAKRYAYMCSSCFEEHCKSLGVPAPKL